MAPSIHAFAQFLISKNRTFRTLRGVIPVTINSQPKIVRTTHFAEAHILIDKEEYLLSLPLNGEIATNIARTATAIGLLGSPVLTQYKILPAEIELPDSTGKCTPCDLILHRIPAGESLDKAVSHLPTEQLHTLLDILCQEVVKVGFLHGNLKPSNLIFTENGHLYPIRYHYAKVGASEEQILAEIDAIRNYINSHPKIELIGTETTPAEYEQQLPYDEIFPMQDLMRRVRKGELYGYIDSNNNEVIEPQYTYAENFFENRAVVRTLEGKMGVIDHGNRWILEPIYDMVGFEDGLFDARIGDEWHKFDYLGVEIK